MNINFKKKKTCENTRIFILEIKAIKIYTKLIIFSHFLILPNY